jgi:hypothetical protein
MVESKAESDSEEGWGSGYGSEDNAPMADIKMKEYEILSADAVKVKMMSFLGDLNELYNLNDNDLMKLARHYKWNSTKMQNDWFGASEAKIFKLKKELGMVFDKDLLKKFPGLS